MHRFDHHCIWIDNCVGRDNFCPFFTYITTLLAYFASQIIFGLYFFVGSCLSEEKDLSLVSQHPKYNVLLGHPADDWLAFLNVEMADSDWSNTLMQVTWLENALIALIFLMPLTLLVVVQVQNVCKNSTTNLRFSKRKRVDHQDDFNELMQ